MVTVFLVRHGVTAATGTRLGGRTAAALNDDGAAQAKAVAQRLGSANIVAVYASPIVRTMQTATPIAAAHGLEVEEVEGVQEVEYGDWTDRPIEELRQKPLWTVIQQRPSRVTFPEGESIRGAQVRAVEAIEAVVARHEPTERPDEEDGEAGDEDNAEHEPPPAVVIVSHADIIKAVVAHYLGQPLDLFQRLVVGPASITGLVLSTSGTPRLVVLNDSAHLSDGG